MKILYELSWLWETLGIALVAAAVCIACAALICKAAKKKLGKKVHHCEQLRRWYRSSRFSLYSLFLPLQIPICLVLANPTRSTIVSACLRLLQAR